MATKLEIKSLLYHLKRDENIWSDLEILWLVQMSELFLVLNAFCLDIAQIKGSEPTFVLGFRHFTIPTISNIQLL